MTLVLKGSIQNTFILIGDSLISGHEREVKIHLPTIGNIESIIPEGSGWSVRNLKKKIDVLGNNIIIGWYGNYQAASVVIGELRKINSVTPLSNITIGDFLSDKKIRSLVGDYIFDGDILGLTGFILKDKNVYSFDYVSRKSEPRTISFLETDNIKIYGSGADHCYDYLTNMSLFSLTQEKIEEFDNKYKNKENEIENIKNTTVFQLWIKELDEFLVEYNKMLKVLEEEKQANNKIIKAGVNKPVKAKKTTVKITKK
jgi:hypothetical protein